MLWYKSWLDTQLWFFLAICALVAQVIALYMSYPMDPLTTYPNGALGVLPHEMAQIRTGDFRSYIWVRWFSTTMLLIWPVFALRLAGTGLEGERGREYLLSLARPSFDAEFVAQRAAAVVPGPGIEHDPDLAARFGNGDLRAGETRAQSIREGSSRFAHQRSPVLLSPKLVARRIFFCSCRMP